MIFKRIFALAADYIILASFMSLVASRLEQWIRIETILIDRLLILILFIWIIIFLFIIWKLIVEPSLWNRPYNISSKYAKYAIDILWFVLAGFLNIITLIIAIGGIQSPTSATNSSLLFLQWIFIPWLYWAAMISSNWQTTLGGKIFGLRVVDAEGKRISFVRAAGRYLSWFVTLWSIELIVPGIIIAVIHKPMNWPKGQFIHDIMIGTRVVMRNKEGKWI